jgi:hypothetical protein
MCEHMMFPAVASHDDDGGAVAAPSGRAVGVSVHGDDAPVRRRDDRRVTWRREVYAGVQPRAVGARR